MIFFQENASKNVVCKIWAIMFRPRYTKQDNNDHYDYVGHYITIMKMAVTCTYHKKYGHSWFRWRIAPAPNILDRNLLALEER